MESAPSKSVSGDPRVLSIQLCPEEDDEAFLNERKQLAQRLAAEKPSKIIRAMPRGGNCMFQSLCDQFWGTTGKHLQLRGDLVKYIRANRELYQQLLPRDVNGSSEEYCTKMSHPGSPGDYLVLQAASDLYLIEIRVVASSEANDLPIIRPRTSTHPRHLLELAYIGLNHYDSIQPQSLGPIQDDVEPESIQNFLGSLKGDLAGFVSARGGDILKNAWDLSWKTLLDDCLESARSLPRTVVGVVGGTGTGKSTLLNAIIGASILPNKRDPESVTPVPIEVGYAKEGKIEVEILFASIQEWEEEAEKLWLARDPADPNDPAGKALMAVYDRKNNGQVFEEAEKALQDGTLKLPAESSVASLREAIECHIFPSSTKGKNQPGDHLWPLVKRVSIRGPFDVLRNGVLLVDLPGINDVNKARERITNEYLLHCDHLWVATHCNRLAAQDDFPALMCKLDGRSVTVIGTKMDEEIKEINNGKRCLLKERYRHAAEAYMEKQKIFHAGSIYITSSQDYLDLTESGGKKERAKFDLEETEIPALRHLLQNLARVRTSRLYGAVHAANTVLDAIMMDLARKKPAGAALQGRFENRQSKLRSRMENARKSLSKKLAVLSQLKAAIHESFSNAYPTGPVLVGQWRCRYAWNTFKATCANSGRFASSGRAGFIDLNAEIVQQPLTSLTDTWQHVLNDAVPRVLEEFKALILLEVEAVQRDMEKDSPEVPPSPVDTVRWLLSEQLKKILLQVVHGQRLIHRSFADTAEACMEPAYRQAAREGGGGMFDRMINAFNQINWNAAFQEIEKKAIDMLCQLEACTVSSCASLTTLVEERVKKVYEASWLAMCDVDLSVRQQFSDKLQAQKKILLGYYPTPASIGKSEVKSQELDELEKAMEAMRIRYECIVCMDKPRDCALYPCGHVVVCRGCAKSLVECPVCRANITMIIPIFL